MASHVVTSQQAKLMLVPTPRFQQEKVRLTNRTMLEVLLHKLWIAGQAIPLLAHRAIAEELPHRQLRVYALQADVVLQIAPELGVHNIAAVAHVTPLSGHRHRHLCMQTNKQRTYRQRTKGEVYRCGYIYSYVQLRRGSIWGPNAFCAPIEDHV